MRFCLSSKWVSCGFIRVLFFFLSINCSLFSTSILSGQFFTGLFTPPHYSFFFFFTWIKSSQVTAFDDVMASHSLHIAAAIFAISNVVLLKIVANPCHIKSNQLDCYHAFCFFFFSRFDTSWVKYGMSELLLLSSSLSSASASFQSQLLEATSKASVLPFQSSMQLPINENK